MGARGRKSSADLSVIGSAGVVQTKRPSAPSDLTDEQAAEWRAIINVHPAEWLTRDRQAMLVALCRHIISQRYTAQLIDQCMASDDYDVNMHDKLLKMQERETRTILSASVRLGIAQTTLYEKNANKKGPQLPKPWEG